MDQMVTTQFDTGSLEEKTLFLVILIHDYIHS